MCEDNPERYVVVWPKTLAKMLKVSQKKLKVMIAEGKIPEPFKLSSSCKIWNKLELMDFLKEHYPEAADRYYDCIEKL